MVSNGFLVRFRVIVANRFKVRFRVMVSNFCFGYVYNYDHDCVLDYV